jgi:DNA-binding transcriptional ArsR family regulator
MTDMVMVSRDDREALIDYNAPSECADYERRHADPTGSTRERVRHALSGEPATVAELARRAGISERTARRHLDALSHTRCERCRRLIPNARRRLCTRCGEAAHVVVCPTCGARRPTDGLSLGAPNVTRNPDGTWSRHCGSCRRTSARAREDAIRLLRDRDWLQRAYDSAPSAEEIAREIGVKGETVLRWLRRHRIPVRSLSDTLARVHATRSVRLGRNRQMVTGATNWNAATIEQRPAERGIDRRALDREKQAMLGALRPHAK